MKTEVELRCPNSTLHPVVLVGLCAASESLMLTTLRCDHCMLNFLLGIDDKLEARFVQVVQEKRDE